MCGAPESGWLYQILAGNVITSLEPLLNAIIFKFLKSTGLGLTVTEIKNIKKVQKQDLKNIKNLNGCKDGMPKSMQASRDDIIVKVNLQSSIPTSFYLTVAN